MKGPGSSFLLRCFEVFGDVNFSAISSFVEFMIGIGSIVSSRDSSIADVRKYATRNA